MVANVRAYAPVLALIIGLIALMAAKGTGGHGVMAQQTYANMDCTNPIVSLLPCLSYMTIPANPYIPDDDCCAVLAVVITSDAKCLCQLFATNYFLGFPINKILAFSLPAACNLDFPREIGQCTVVFLPPSAGTVDQPGSNPPPPFDAVPPVNLPPVPPRESIPVGSPPSINVPHRSPDHAHASPSPKLSGAGALSTPSVLRLFWVSLTGILTVGYLR